MFEGICVAVGAGGSTEGGCVCVSCVGCIMCASRTVVCSVLDEGVLQGYVVWLCVWRAWLVSSGARCVVNEGTRQWGEGGYAVCV